MKKLLYFFVLTIMINCACQRAQSDYSSSPPPASNNSGTNSAAPLPAASKANRALTNSQVETAIADLLSGFRLSGSVRVRGIQELPQQNAAVADLQFEQFEYPVSYEGGLIRVKDFKPGKPGGAISSPAELFPQRRASYSRDGRATLARYTDGRWVLKSVNWDFDTGVIGTVEIR